MNVHLEMCFQLFFFKPQSDLPNLGRRRFHQTGVNNSAMENRIVIQSLYNEGVHDPSII